MSLKCIVTGTGRCGTMFMSKFLSSAKINCGHELIFTNEGIETARTNLKIYEGVEGESSYMAAPFLKEDILQDCKIIHLVREPMKVINSFVVAFCYFLSHKLDCQPEQPYWTYFWPPGADPEFKFMKFIYNYVPELADPRLTPVERAALYYIKWNNIIEQGCQGRDFIIHRIENNTNEISKFLNITKTEWLYDNVNINKAKYKTKFYIDNIRSRSIKSELIDMGRRYGYQMTTASIYII